MELVSRNTYLLHDISGVDSATVFGYLAVIIQDVAQKRAIVRTGFFPESLGRGTYCHLHKGGCHLEDVVFKK
jgi:hypothetical protein